MAQACKSGNGGRGGGGAHTAHTAHGAWRRSCIGAAALVCWMSAGSRAMAHDPGASAALQDLQAFYSANPVCERVGVQVKTPAEGGGTSKSFRASYALKYRCAVGTGLATSLTLELGSYLLDATPTDVTLAHARNSTTYFRDAIEGAITSQTLAEVVPPVPLPQLDLAQAQRLNPTDGVCTEFWPYASGITWRALETDPRVPTRRTVRGEFTGGGGGGGGSVSLLLNGSRLKLLTIERHQPRLTITLAFTPVTACEPEKRLIEVSSRTRVETLLELKPRGGGSHVGDALPAVSISPAGGGEWSLQDLLDSPAEAVIVGVPNAEHAVLVFTREGPGVAAGGATKVDFDRLGAHLRSTRASAFSVKSTGGALAAQELADLPARFGYARVLVFNQLPDPAPMLEAIKKAGQSWGMRNVLFSASAAESMELVAPGAASAVIIVDSKKVVRAVISIEESTTTERLADQIAGALFELGAPRGMAEFVPGKE